MSGPTPPWDGTQVCAQVDPELFFPSKGGNTDQAKALCRTCPLVLPCLEYALALDDAHGVWGATSPTDRRRLRRRRRADRDRTRWGDPPPTPAVPVPGQLQLQLARPARSA